MPCWPRKVRRRYQWLVMTFDELAPAKVNLSLHVVGQRGDGYHLLDSLVLFANIGDRVSYRENAQELELQVTGREAGDVPKGEDNLVVQAARLVGLQSGRLLLEKELPVAAGIGGGSADAAAVLRGSAKGTPSLGTKLGADVPVCMAGHAARMRGIGDEVTAVNNLPDLFAVLVNPRCLVLTEAVFKQLTNKNGRPMSAVPSGASYVDFVNWLAQQRNDLQLAAIALEPKIAAVLAELAETNADLVRMSGSGATCFGLFSSWSAAADAAQQIARHRPTWWVAPTQLS